jgi:nucleoside permease NupC
LSHTYTHFFFFTHSFDIIGYGLAIVLGTSASESLSAAGNIFVGQTEAPLLVKPFMPEMTESELHAVMTGGFATIAGSVFGIYISFGKMKEVSYV